MKGETGLVWDILQAEAEPAVGLGAQAGDGPQEEVKPDREAQAGRHVTKGARPPPRAGSEGQWGET